MSFHDRLVQGSLSVALRGWLVAKLRFLPRPLRNNTVAPQELQQDRPL